MAVRYDCGRPLSESSRMSLAELDKLVFDELFRAFERQQLSEDLWLSRDISPQSSMHITLYVAKCPGGAYSQFGTIKVNEDHVYMMLKTVKGIISRRSEHTKHNLPFCDPHFPDNLIELVKTAAKNAQKCFDLSHSRTWMRYRRERCK